jgi:CheY-like chemotaxis protein
VLVAETYVLIVDDQADVREMASVLLEAAGFAVRTAAGGRAALRQVGDQAPTAIVMDIAMPDLDGIETARVLKADVRYAGIPVIAYTAQQDFDRLGLFDSVCPKWATPDELVQLVSVALGVAGGAGLRVKNVRARAVSLRERALTLCRASRRRLMQARLAGVIAKLGELLERLDGMLDDELLAHEADLLSNLIDRVAECESRLQLDGPDADTVA